VAAPGDLDHNLNEFWVTNPWQITNHGHNLSAFERSRTFMNLHGGNFIDVSWLSGADDDGDGRAVVAGDFRNNGRMDLVVRKSSGGALQMYENNYPQRHYLKVSLRGKDGNRAGIGARLVAEVNGQKLVREMYPTNTYQSQAPNIVHFGLGDHDRVERLTIRWSNGEEQELSNLAGDRHIIVTYGEKGKDAVETIVPGQTIRP
jgi:hypothetical protein